MMSWHILHMGRIIRNEIFLLFLAKYENESPCHAHDLFGLHLVIKNTLQFVHTKHHKDLKPKKSQCAQNLDICIIMHSAPTPNFKLRPSKFDTCVLIFFLSQLKRKL